MAAIGMGRPVARDGRWFHTGMAALIAAYVFYGFGRTYLAALPAPGMPFWVHLHGAAFTGWIVLFGVQSWLGGRRAFKLHRQLGWASVALVVAMVPLGIATTLLCVKRGATPSFFTPGIMVALDGLGLLGFVSLYGAAIALRRNADWHKRLMLCGAILLSSPGLGRILPLGGLGPLAPLALVAVMLVLVAAGVANDIATRGRPHPAYAWGAVAITISILAAGPIAFSPPMNALVAALKG